MDSSIDPSMDEVADIGRSLGDAPLGASEEVEVEVAAALSLSPSDCERLRGRSKGELTLGETGGFSETLRPRDGWRKCPAPFEEPAPLIDGKCAVSDEL